MNEQSISSIEELSHTWQDILTHNLPSLVLSVVILIGFFFLARFSKKLTNRFILNRLHVHPEVVSVVSAFVYLLFLLTGISISLSILGFDNLLTKLVAGAGIIGIVAGFAFRDIASNIFAGLILKIQHPFKAGDWVEIDSSYGEVREIGWITTQIKTVPGQQVYVPNQIIYRHNFTNFSMYHKRRIILEGKVSFNEDLEKVKKVAMEEAHLANSSLKDDIVDFYYTDIGNYAYTFQLRFWIFFRNNADYRRGLDEIIIRIKNRFEKENIRMAYPITSLDFDPQQGTTLFDKPVQVRTQEEK